MKAEQLAKMLMMHPDYEVHWANIFVQGQKSIPIEPTNVVSSVEEDRVWLIFPPPAKTVYVTNSEK